MAEFVEQFLEDLVPVFEQLNATQILSEKEVNLLVKRCRRYDYRLQKSHKRPEDFLHYGEYLTDLLDLITERRKAIGYNHKKQLIEYAINKKTASIYRRLCHRFQGQLSYWLKYIHFAASHNMKMETSKAFIQAMQMHPRSLDLRVKAARWEWEENKSIENARRGIQLAIRLHPEAVHLWSTLFEIELDYVMKLKRRRELLMETKRGERTTGGEEEESIIEPSTPAATDAVLQLRLAEIVMEQAMETIGGMEDEEKMRELLLLLWRACRVLPVGDADADRVRGIVEERMERVEDEGMKRRMEVEKRMGEGEDVLEVLSTRDWKDAEIGEMRWARGLMVEKGEREEDPIALSRARDLLLEIVKREECTEEEYEEWAREGEVEGEEERRVVERAVMRFPRRALFWRRLLEDEGRGVEGEDVKGYVEKINKGIEKAGDDEDSEEAVKLFQLAIDTTIEHYPQMVEKVFQSSLDSSTGATHRALKELRVDYLLSVMEGEEGKEKRWGGVEKKLRELVQRRPNSVSFYIHLGEKLIELAGRSGKGKMVEEIDQLIDTTLAAAVAEHSDSDDAWIARCELLMERAPLKVAEVYRRALLSLKGDAAETFITRYTALQQAAATKSC